MNSSTTNRPLPHACDVLLAVDAYLPWSGGSRIYYDNLYRRLADQHGLSIRVETSHCSGDEIFDRDHNSQGPDIRRHGERLPDWKLKRTPVLAGKMLRIACAAASTEPAAIHCGDLFPQDFTGAALRKITGLPLLVFVHGDEVNQTEHRRVQPRLRNGIYRSADAIVAANSFAYERAVAICGTSERVSMITPGVDCIAFHPGPRPEWASREYHLDDSPVMITVARLVKKKGHETVLRSLPAILKLAPALKYLIVGGGPEESRLRTLTADLGLRECVRFVGDVPHRLLPDIYRAADVFCMVNEQDASGDIESFGMVFIEAGACGLPVIGGRSGGTAQSVLEGRTGLLCEPSDPDRLSQLLLGLLSNASLRRQMGEAGLQRARSEFGWDARARQLLEVHQGIVDSEQFGLRVRRTCQARWQ